MLPLKWLPLILLLICAVAHAEPIQTGKSKITVGSGEKALDVFTYKPTDYTDGELLVVCHGKSRNAEDYRNYAVTIADQLKVIVVAALFDEKRFSSDEYIRGGVVSKSGKVKKPENWTFPLLLNVIANVREREGKPHLAYRMIGHSAGGQFLERFAAFQPNEAKRIVVANPGSHLFPRLDWDYGYGLKGLTEELSNEAFIKRYLAAPLTIYLGTGDIDPNDKVLDKSEGAEKQGAFRLERGRACFAFAQKLAKDNGWPFNWKTIETPGIGHDGGKMFAAKEAVQALLGK